jgi:hypothetical protein
VQCRWKSVLHLTARETQEYVLEIRRAVQIAQVRSLLQSRMHWPGVVHITEERLTADLGSLCERRKLIA